MAKFNYEIEHRPSKQYCNADALSCERCCQCGLDFSCTEFEEEEKVMMAAEVSILPVWSNEGKESSGSRCQSHNCHGVGIVRHHSKAMSQIQPGNSNTCGPRGVI